MINPLVNHLEQYALFGGLNDEELNHVAGFLKEERFRDGFDIIKEGEKGDRVYCLLEGAVLILKNAPDGKGQVEVARLSQGATFGEMELIDTQTRSATVRVVGEVRVVSMSNKDLLHILHDNHHVFTVIIMNLARDLSRRIRCLDAELCKLRMAD